MKLFKIVALALIAMSVSSGIWAPVPDYQMQKNILPPGAWKTDYRIFGPCTWTGDLVTCPLKSPDLSGSYLSTVRTSDCHSRGVCIEGDQLGHPRLGCCPSGWRYGAPQ